MFFVYTYIYIYMYIYLSIFLSICVCVIFRTFSVWDSKEGAGGCPGVRNNKWSGLEVRALKFEVRILKSKFMVLKLKFRIWGLLDQRPLSGSGAGTQFRKRPCEVTSLSEGF